MDERERIEKVMQSEKLNSTQFAIEIGIQNSTLSHILNGRNNPSLDVLKRILNRFRTISSDWLILGIGSMYRQERNSQGLTLFDSVDENNSSTTSYNQNIESKILSPKEPLRVKSETEVVLPIEKRTIQQVEERVESIKESSKKTVKVIVYYSDNTFEEFDPK
jgi:transcriptional regulator with XRE-family HTH domain